jgi:hypothetical protein
MTALNGGELAANATRALEHYRGLERLLEIEIAARTGRLDQVREFIAALTTPPRPSRKPRAISVDGIGQAIDPPEAPQTDMELAG